MKFYSKFDEKGDLISRYALIKDITKSSDKRITRPVDFLLNGFQKSKKLALLIDPLNSSQYEYSEGFYDIVEEKSDTKELRQFKVVNNPKSTDIYHISSLKNGQIESFHYDYISDLFYSSNPLLQSILSYLQGVDIGDKEKEELYAENIYSINIFYTILKAKEMFKKLSVSRDCLVISYKHKAIRLPNTVFNNYINQHLSYVNHHNENKSRWNYKIVLRGHHNNYITIYDRLIVYDDTAIFDDNRLTALNEYLDIIFKI